MKMARKRDRNSIWTDEAIPIMVDEAKADVKAMIKATFSPSTSPNRPNIGPPVNCAKANAVWRCPNTIGSAPNFVVKN